MNIRLARHFSTDEEWKKLIEYIQFYREQYKEDCNTTPQQPSSTEQSVSFPINKNGVSTKDIEQGS